jgi:hypothetical protein
VGFVEGPDGALLVAAGDAGAAWANNLLADPRCTVTLGERSYAAVAEQLEETQRNAAVVQLILKYGTPAERLGAGPAFRIRPVGSTGATGARATP